VREGPRRIRRGLAGLLVAGSLLGGAASAPPVQAQDAGGVTGDEIFGGYTLTSRASGLQATYDVPGMLPVSPIVQLSVPEALATLSSGPSGYGLASLAFPGPLIADLGTVIALASDEAPEVPGYPIRQEAFYPSGPTEAEEGTDDGTMMRAATEPGASEALTRYAGMHAPPVVTAGNIVSASRSSIEDGRAVTRARTEVTDVSILGGVVQIDSIVTDLVAANNGEESGSDGATVVSGVRFLGLAATLDERGLVLAEAPAPQEGPVPGDALPGLGDLGGALQPGTDPLNQALREVLDQAVPSVNELLEAAGVTIEVLDPVESTDTGMVSRSAAGVVVDVRYVGQDQEPLVELVDALPPDMRQALGPIPNPVNFLVETHVTTLSLGTASVSSTASPLFEVDIPPFEAPMDLDLVAPGAPGSAGAGPGFSTPVPGVPGAGGGGGPGSGGSTTLSTSPTSALLSGAIPAFLILALAMGAPLFAAGTSRLADNVLAPSDRSCPYGLDRVPDPAPADARTD
jgi:hypothetical protein